MFGLHPAVLRASNFVLKNDFLWVEDPLGVMGIEFSLAAYKLSTLPAVLLHQP